ncbi:MAG: DUF29 domain-containing protein [Planctomycetes bacterium]|nr:DUF29 domain-containing protein [Planctomycetota bacterium]
MTQAGLQLPLPDLFEQDETAWLEAMSRLILAGHFEELDFDHLSEYLSDMARRDKREVLSRLTTLLAHLLKWEQQPEKRTRSWAATIANQRDELADLLESKTLLKHAAEALPKAYGRAVKQAALETGLAETEFPADCPHALETILQAT